MHESLETASSTSQPLSNDFYWNHLVLPSVLFVGVLIAIEWFQLDRLLAGFIYDNDLHSWSLRSNYLLEEVIHKDGRLLFALMIVSLIALYFTPRYKMHKRPLAFLILSVLISVISINLIKKISGVPCPWSVDEFGGTQHIMHWFNGFNGQSGCFPAGHASAGYAWVALYFFALVQRRSLRFHGLFFGLGLGFIYGFAQELRGAHFLSHDIWTAAICWVVPAALFHPFFGKSVSQSEDSASSNP